MAAHWLETGVIAAFLLGSSALRAQTPPQLAPPALSQTPQTEACELHLWSAPNYITDISGLFPQYSAIGAIETAGTRAALQPDGRSALESWLAPEFISQTAQAADLPTLMGRPVSVTLHQTSRSEVGRIMRVPVRATPSTAACYHELYVRTIFLQQSLVYGTKFFVAWRLKTFSAEKRQPKVVTSTATLQLPGFRVDRPQAEVRADLEDALKRSFETFIRGAINGSIS